MASTVPSSSDEPQGEHTKASPPPATENNSVAGPPQPLCATAESTPETPSALAPVPPDDGDVGGGGHDDFEGSFDEFNTTAVGREDDESFLSALKPTESMADFILKAHKQFEEAKERGDVVFEVHSTEELKTVPKVAQGNAALYDDSTVAARAAIKHSEPVQKLFLDLWDMMPKKLLREFAAAVESSPLGGLLDSSFGGARHPPPPRSPKGTPPPTAITPPQAALALPAAGGAASRRPSHTPTTASSHVDTSFSKLTSRLHLQR
jgi:hypothetical protein